jgi:pyruvate dehydrogenase E1 component beta subunit
MVSKTIEVASLLSSKCSIEILDPRTIVPLDEEAILQSIKKTGKLVVVDEDYERCGFSAEVAAIAVEKGFQYLDAPVIRVANPNVPIPYSPTLESRIIPSTEKILKAITQLV